MFRYISVFGFWLMIRTHCRIHLQNDSSRSEVVTILTTPYSYYLEPGTQNGRVTNRLPASVKLLLRSLVLGWILPLIRGKMIMQKPFPSTRTGKKLP